MPFIHEGGSLATRQPDFALLESFRGGDFGLPFPLPPSPSSSLESGLGTPAMFSIDYFSEGDTGLDASALASLGLGGPNAGMPVQLEQLLAQLSLQNQLGMQGQQLSADQLLPLLGSLQGSLQGAEAGQQAQLLALQAMLQGGSPTAAMPISGNSRTGPNNNPLYKTEKCRSFEEFGSCRYGTKCQFAHGPEELRPVQRHPRYKTEICRTFATTGTCPYGTRCRFIHQSQALAQLKMGGSSPSPAAPAGLDSGAPFGGPLPRTPGSSGSIQDLLASSPLSYHSPKPAPMAPFSPPVTPQSVVLAGPAATSPSTQPASPAAGLRLSGGSACLLGGSAPSGSASLLPYVGRVPPPPGLAPIGTARVPPPPPPGPPRPPGLASAPSTPTGAHPGTGAVRRCVSDNVLSVTGTPTAGGKRLPIFASLSEEDGK